MSQEPATPVATAPRRSHAWVAWIVGAVVLAVITVLSLAVLADLGMRTYEMNRLLTAVEKSESAMKKAQDDVVTALEPYASGNLSAADRAKINARLEEIAAQGHQDIADAGNGVGAVWVLPWHAHIAEAQQAYLRHNGAWVAYMTAAQSDPQQWFADQPDVNSTFAAAKMPFVEGVTLFDIGNALGRIKAIFAEDQPVQDNGGSNGGGQPA